MPWNLFVGVPHHKLQCAEFAWQPELVQALWPRTITKHQVPGDRQLCSLCWGLA